MNSSARILGVFLSFTWASSGNVSGAWHSTAHAQSHRIGRACCAQRPMQLDVHGGLVWSGPGLATGARFGIPIVPNGFVPRIDNAVYLNFGADLYYLRYPDAGGHQVGLGIGFPVTLHWEFFFDEHWSAFSELGANIFLHPQYFDSGSFYVDPFRWFIVASGGSYAFNDHIAITLRIGSPYIAFGMTMSL